MASFLKRILLAIVFLVLVIGTNRGHGVNAAPAETLINADADEGAAELDVARDAAGPEEKRAASAGRTTTPSFPDSQPYPEPAEQFRIPTTRRSKRTAANAAEAAAAPENSEGADEGVAELDTAQDAGPEKKRAAFPARTTPRSKQPSTNSTPKPFEY